ncbi:DUF3341 domain-containing protein [Pseudomonas palleroniana]|uniref:DUF3341 domain-containing protein n=1 Tax=Pseudomonas palleroniana TaxID=191390 RepID=UPI0018E6C9DF|nr:DUF3341 domain-containing protein [Pseudomonas palleroniana]MBI6908294.1 DUF3341 domain-containing protein [Pseudomonas palleroniana]
MAECLGLLARFPAPEPLVEAGLCAWNLGYRRLDAFAPFALQALEPVLTVNAKRVPRMACLGAGIGVFLALVMQIGSVWAYPLNIGGRPLVAVPSFAVVTFLFAVVFAAAATVLTLLLCSHLPRLHHPLFDVEAFECASDDGFFLFIDARDPLFDAHQTQAWLAERALSVHEVAR